MTVRILTLDIETGRSRLCSKCKSLSPLANFYMNHGVPHVWCKPCVRFYEQLRRQVLEVAEQRREYERSRRKRNPTEVNALGREARLKRLYGLSAEDYEQLLEKQERACAICLKLWQPQSKRMAVDHCHRTGKVRGLLCFDCNTSIGKMNDDPELLRKAASYLEGSI